MNSFFRYLGIINAAIWFGGGVFFTCVVAPGVFSADTHKLFGDAAQPFFSGGVALILLRRYFVVQIICGVVALLILLAEKFYLGRALPRAGTALVLALLGLSLAGGLWLQPRMENLRQTKYFGATPAQKEQAGQTFGRWHGISMGANLLALAGLFTHLVKSSSVRETKIAGRFTKFYR